MSDTVYDLCSRHGTVKDMMTDCERCKGEGYIEEADEYRVGSFVVKCWFCDGTGHGFLECRACLESAEYGDEDDSL